MRYAGAVACAALLAGCASLGVGGPDVRYLVETADHVARAESRVSAIWPGFWEPGRPFVVYHPGQAVLLVADAPPPDGFRTLEHVPGSLRGRAHVYAGRLRGLDGNIDLHFRIGGLEVTAVPYRGDVFRTLTLLYHEAFHQTQDRRFADRLIPARLRLTGVADDDLDAILEVERRLLVAALDAAYPVRPGGRSGFGDIAPARIDDVRRLSLDYLAVRAARTDRLSDRRIALERQHERFEGTATFVGVQAALVAMEWERGLAGPAVARTWLVEPPREEPETDLGTRLHDRAYGTGAALGLLLEALGVSWHGAVEAGSSLDVLLSEAIGFGDLTTDEQGRLSRAALARLAANRVGGVEPVTAEATGASYPGLVGGRHVLVEVDIPVPAGGRRPRVALNYADRFAYSGSGLDGRPEFVSLGRPLVMSIVGDGVSLVARGHDAWLDRRDPSRVVFLIRVPSWPTVNGIDPRALPGGLEGSLVLEGRDFEARLDGGGAVTAESDRLLVRIGGP